MTEFLPETDGIDHINVYSKSRSKLGRMLSNFANTPITIQGEHFESVESWWYWSKMNKINNSLLFPVFSEENLLEVKGLIGNDAKQFYRKLYGYEGTLRPTKDELKMAYLQKLSEHPEIKQMLIDNKLPIDHYYMMFEHKISADSTAWTAQLWEEIKKELI